MRRDYDADAQPNASGAQYNFKIKDAGKWTKVVVYYDMGQVVNAISSKKANSFPEQRRCCRNQRRDIEKEIKSKGFNIVG